ncbi:MAG: HlyC/CorC family transporter, partial [Acidobacteria bacterium]|nr:HlyC/CorC family transporter [Acidobacteriota bacterium]
MITVALASLIILALVLLNGIFVASEFAIVGAPKAAIERRAGQGERVARRVLQILREPQRQGRFIATSQIGISLASLGLGMYGEHVVAAWIAAGLEPFGTSRWLAAHTLAGFLSIAALTCLHIVLGEMVPKSVALQNPEGAILWLAPLMMWTERLFLPLVIGLNALGNGILRLIGVNRQLAAPEHYLTTEELQLVIEESEEAGALRAESGRVLRELFEFGALTAGEVMVPRVRITGIPLGASPDTLRSILRSSQNTRYPVYESDFDHVTGMIHIKDLLRHLLTKRPVTAAETRPLPVVPDTLPIDQLLALMQRERTQIALVIDEHGGTAGIVTLEDVFEEVVGAIEEGPPGQRAVYVGADGRLRTSGTLRLDELGQELGIELEHQEVDSVSGLVLTLLGRPPRVGDVVSYGGLALEVTAVKGYGVEQCAVSLEHPPESSATQ